MDPVTITVLAANVIALAVNLFFGMRFMARVTARLEVHDYRLAALESRQERHGARLGALTKISGGAP